MRPIWAAARIIIAIVLVLGPMFYFGRTEETAKMGVAAAAGLAAAMFLNLDRLSRIKLLGFEAELAEVVREAYAKLEIVRHLTTATLVAHLRRIRMDSGTFRVHEKVYTVAELVAAAEALGVIDDPGVSVEIEKAQKFITVDLWSALVMDTMKKVSGEFAGEFLSIGWDSPEEYIRGVFERHGVNVDQMEEFLYYRKCRAPKRPFVADPDDW